MKVEDQQPSKATEATDRKVRKDSTTDLPMFDLNEVVTFVSGVHEKALETSPMPVVAKGMNYGNPSSTPFYRRMVAARLFGMLSANKAELTVRAKDYLKPDADSTRLNALKEAILGIPIYSEEVQKHIGKKINQAFIANSFIKVLPISDSCAKLCARVFEDSIRFAGFLAADGTVVLPNPPEGCTKGNEDKTTDTEDEVEIAGMRPHILPLDKNGKRIVKVLAPLDITPTEIKRIQKWMEVTLLIEWEEGGKDLLQ